MTTPEILNTRDGQPIVPGMAVVVCHVPEHDFYAGLIYEATVAEIRPNGIILSQEAHRVGCDGWTHRHGKLVRCDGCAAAPLDGSRTGARSLFSSREALDRWVETNEALAEIDAQMLRNAR